MVHESWAIVSFRLNSEAIQVKQDVGGLDIYQVRSTIDLNPEIYIAYYVGPLISQSESLNETFIVLRTFSVQGPRTQACRSQVSI